MVYTFLAAQPSFRRAEAAPGAKRYVATPFCRVPCLSSLPTCLGYPILGSVPDIPEKNSFIKFAEWGKEYGPIYQVNLAGSNHIWISSDHIARDLLAKKGAIYSDRPHIPALLSDNRTSAQYLPLLSKNGKLVFIVPSS